MSALEYQFPDPSQAPSAYMDVVKNAFENIVGRWDQTTCGGGLKWQIYPENAYGYNYKNSISNGCAFALGARLARFTGEQKYADWAVKIYDWTKKVGLISDSYEVFDGTDDKTNCASVADKTQWSYNNAMFLHGSAFMFDFTNGGSVWKDRTSGFLSHAELLFFNPYENATNIMYEWACETGESGRHCNLDQQSFKAYLARFMAKTALMAPFTKDTITKYLKASAVGAAKSCSGGADGVTCGSKWYTGKWDGTSGVGQQLSALEVTQALLMIKEGTLPVKNSATQPSSSTAVVPKSSSTPAAVPTSAPASEVPAYSTPPAPAASSVEVVQSSSNVPEAASASSSSESLSTAFVRPSAIVTIIASSSPNATDSSGGQFNEAGPTSSACSTPGGVCSCTPTTTTTVYVPASSQTAVPVVPSVTSTLISVAPPANSSLPNATQPLEFQGAAVNVEVRGCSVLGAIVVVLVAALL